MKSEYSFNFTYRYIDDVLSINNSRFAEFLPLICPPELKAKIDQRYSFVRLFLGVACFTFVNFV
jgi:hypothetical protein